MKDLKTGFYTLLIAVLAMVSAELKAQILPLPLDQQVLQGNILVVEGLLQAKYGEVPYEMRFVTIFHFQQGKIVKKYDYYDNKDWYKAKEEWEQRKNRAEKGK
ncbi:MAG: hypothetical protein SFV55_07055 [Haliscomenobacter sp.]|uniref:nuclear transport factor 2 family protein n=1 Tax=Haliscomenobacter sp. TaxID=2717303 RepID=UPI0029A0A551|nr:hypothetical protein [Haliscomenobacter sp.]MDX2068168.1 hypothetical protein [Haliscomenobacter sp.]